MIKGVIGQIKWYYQVAADINGYTVARTPQNEWSLRATVASADAFRLSQRPLMFVAPMNNRVFNEKEQTWVSVPSEWRWPIESVEVEGNSVAAKLGPPLQ